MSRNEDREEVEEEKEIEEEEVSEEEIEENKVKTRVSPKVKEIEYAITRVSTGIEELDKVLSGGVPKGSWVVIGGEPGTGKTIMAIHFAWAGLEGNDKVIYVTTEQEFWDVVKQAQQFGINFKEYNVVNLSDLVTYSKKEKEYKLEQPEEKPDIVVIDLFGLARINKLIAQEVEEGRKRGGLPWSYQTLINALNKVYNEVLDIEKTQHVRLIIDSISVLWAHAPAMARRISYQLKLAYHRSNITALLTSQYAMTTKSIFGFGIEHIADVVIETWMSDVKSEKRVERYLVIKKARMTPLPERPIFKIVFERSGEGYYRVRLVPT